MILKRGAVAILSDLLDERRILAQVDFAPADDEHHQHGNQNTEDRNNDADRHIEPEHECVNGNHQQNIELFVEVLHGDRMPR